MFKKTFLSVIVPTYHDVDRLRLCIKCLEMQTYPADLFEVIVVNNDPNHVLGDLNLPDNFRLVTESKPGSYSARNLGLHLARGEIIAFTDSDCQPQSDWLSTAVEIFERNPNVDRIGGVVNLILTGEKPTLGEIYEKAYAFRQEDFVLRRGMAATANMITKSSVIEEIGGFNDQLMSGGDAEWGERAQSKGFKIIYSEQCVVLHPTRSRLSEIVQKTKREAGGHYALEMHKPKFKIIIMLVFGFLPPVKSMARVFRDSHLSVGEKLIAIAIRYYLRLVSTVEKISLLLSLKKMERK